MLSFGEADRVGDLARHAGAAAQVRSRSTTPRIGSGNSDTLLAGSNVLPQERHLDLGTGADHAGRDDRSATAGVRLERLLHLARGPRVERSSAMRRSMSPATPAATSTPGLFVDAVVDASTGTVQVPVLLGGAFGSSPGPPVTVRTTRPSMVRRLPNGLLPDPWHLTFRPAEDALNISVPIIDRATGRPGASR